MHIRLICLLACSLLTLSLLAGPAIVTDPSQTGLDAAALARTPSRMKEFHYCPVNDSLASGN